MSIYVTMQDVDTALEDIARLREQLAASSRFQGLAPSIVALTGALALGMALWQAIAGEDDLKEWMLLSGISGLLIYTEAVSRARRIHHSMANRMLSVTLQRFMPAALAGGIIGVTVLWQLPEHTRLLPGLWQIIMAVGICAVMGSLPRQTIWAAGFYFLSGSVSLALAAGGTSIALLMGLPFGLGQLLMAAILHLTVTGRIND